ncbi:MAG: contractile injection system tape measure protein [Cyanobacteriota bacterium]
MSHLVDRLELDIHTADAAQARRLQDRLSRLHHQALEDVLARVLDRFSSPDTIQRLDTLSLDLGTMAADELEQRFPERLERALGEALRSRLHTAQRIPITPDRDPPREPGAAEVGRIVPPPPGTPPADAPSAQTMATPASAETPAPSPSPPPAPQAPGAPPADAPSAQPIAMPDGAETSPPPSRSPAAQASEARDLELLACFAALGVLPWWAPRQDARLIPATLARALRLPPQTLFPFLRQLAAGSTAFQRLLAASEPAQRPLLLQALGSSAADTPEPGPPQREPQASLAARDSAHPGQDPDAADPARPAPPHKDDTLAVDGAGLALLWPFLPTLFERLGWLTPERRFIGPVPQQRALALLGYLVHGDPRPPEWRLPLAKLLCGLPLDAVFTLEDDLSTAELAEGDKLLQAALAHGDGLLGDDGDSLRATWLQRPGLLSWRPQAWLLVVERRDAIDGALERLPWTVSWLSLPWMVELVQVGW